LLSLSRRTVTGLISTSGRQFADWSADYRFFSKDRVDPGCLFDSIRAEVLKELAPESPFVVAMDDTISRKKGRTIPG
jgi:SRSO17 transposase